jgi:iron transport multicopper oxidase
MLASIRLVAVFWLAFGAFTNAATRIYDWNITWVQANPDNAYWRPTIGINGQWPLPTLYATVGDRVIVNVNNQLGNQTTTLHFHGLYMSGTPHMDGSAMVTQFPIPAGSQFTYNFTVQLTMR